ncbi:MAG: dTMP kinase [Treponema sp.]
MVLHNFIVFEGIDGAGTSTQLKKLAEKVSGDRLFITSEPTGLPTGVFLRRMLKGEFSVDEKTAAYLFGADRCEHVFGTGGIVEQLNSGRLVVSDRYFFSTLAYQSVSCGNELPRMLNSVFPLPELLFYFRINPEVSFGRVISRGEKTEIYEKVDFQQKAATLYDKIMQEYNGTAAAETMQLVTLDAVKPIEETAEIIWSYLKNMPILKS